jgi:spore coat-associated protein N
MQRFAAVWHASPQKMVGVLFALLLAAMMAVGSGANFNSTSANPGNVVTAGNLSHVNGKDGLAILTVDKIKPGERQTGTVTIENDGDIDGVFTVAQAVVSDSNAAAGKPAFADKLRLTITDTTTGDVVYNDGVLSAMGSEDAGTIAPGDTHTYEFEVHFPDGGPNGADNVYKKASVEVDFNWEAVNN